MKPRLYLETTVVSYLTARPMRDVVMTSRQQLTQAWWGKRRADFRICVSPLVLAEAARGDPKAAARRLKVLRGLPVLTATPEVPAVAEALLHSRLLPPNAAADALHIAIASVHGAHFLLTWNFRHIANAAHAAEIRDLVAKVGHVCPVICTPQELFGDLP